MISSWHGKCFNQEISNLCIKRLIGGKFQYSKLSVECECVFSPKAIHIVKDYDYSQNGKAYECTQDRAQYTNQKPMYDTDHNSLIHDSVPHKHVRGSGAIPTTCLSLDNFYH